MSLDHVHHAADVCVIGGGMAGLCAALAAARHGAKTILMHERPVLGGNASSECRVHIGGADRHNGIPFLRETGILEELRMENLRRNPQRSYAVWDTILYEKAHFQPGLTLLLNCSCLGAAMADGRIAGVTGWQQTTQSYQTVNASIFIDCSGDAILAPLTGAEFRLGREARSEFGETIGPEQADRKTMGLTCYFAAREHDTPQPFEKPAWAHTYDDEDLPAGHRWLQQGYWWIELGGEEDSIRDTEALRDELLKTVYGIWDHIKNRGNHGAENWALEWLQFLPGKRESRRYVGDHILTQLDIEAEGKFDDLVAYGGWTMDDHPPQGFRGKRLGLPPTVHHKTPSPYGIPYRVLYSRNVPNLMFAGRNVSCTHMAMSSTRVMGTGCSMGQAAGTAAAIAIREGITPRAVGSYLGELQQTLLRDDAYLPWVPQVFNDLTAGARLVASQGDPEPLRDGINRPVDGNQHCWPCRAGDMVAYHFPHPAQVTTVTLIVDSALDRDPTFTHHYQQKLTAPPGTMPKAFRLEGLANGAWHALHTVTDNHQRLVRLPVAGTFDALRVTLDATWGNEDSRLYAFYVE